MSNRALAFNCFLLGTLLAVSALVIGCRSTEDRRKNRVFYTELWLNSVGSLVTPDTNSVLSVQIAGAPLAIHRRPFLTEEDLEEAEIVESPGGGYSLRLRFNDHGRLVVDTYTAENRGKNVAFFARYGIRKDKDTPLEEKWLAAPLITRHITDGVVTFTPNVSKEELQRIVEGLQNAAELARKPWVF